jgi:hypothetical protein
MSVTPGTRFGPYEVQSRLGSGGMGEVYRALDTRLDRVVALKVLPADRVSDAEARGRFVREAKAVAALNHPNICAIHDVGLAEPDRPPYLVMELLEGQTLQERLLKGPLDVDQVIDVGVALADALETAHARGLIHRDLKPANIFITSRGVPKILDFGLAKALATSDGSSPEIDETRRREDAFTELGTTVGTVAYMSPEQLRGETLDVRSDLFSFGLVLYEMATGQRAFSGATSAVVSANILIQEPVAPTTARPELPLRLGETILKALEKDRALRCQTAAEIRADLTRLKRQSGSQPASGAGMASRTAIATPAEVAPAASTTTSGPRGLVISLGIVAVVVILAGGYWLGIGRGPGEPSSPQVLPAPPPPAAPMTGRDGPPSGAPPAVSTTDQPVATPARSAAAVKPPAASTPAPVATPDATADRGRTGSAEPPAGRGGRPGAAGRRGGSLPSLLSALRGLPSLPFDLVYPPGDERARELALGLRGALVSIGWQCTSTTELAASPKSLTVFVPEQSASVTALMTWARRNGFDPDVRPAPRAPRLRIVFGRQ